MSTTSHPKFLRATPVLRSGDYLRSRDFYGGKLGFKVVEEGGTPPRFGIFERGGSVVFVDAWHGPPAAITGGWSAYLHLSNLESLFAEYQAVDANITREIEDTVYGMREFDVTDPDGNVICFGEDPARRP